MKPLREWIVDQIEWNKGLLDGSMGSPIERHHLNGEIRAFKAVLKEIEDREDSPEPKKIPFPHLLRPGP